MMSHKKRIEAQEIETKLMAQLTEAVENSKFYTDEMHRVNTGTVTGANAYLTEMRHGIWTAQVLKMVNTVRAHCQSAADEGLSRAQFAEIFPTMNKVVDKLSTLSAQEISDPEALTKALYKTPEPKTAVAKPGSAPRR